MRRAPIILFALALCGCGYGRPVCQVIDTAADACTVLRYLEKDGTVREVRVPKGELERFARTEAARQAAAKEAAPK